MHYGNCESCMLTLLLLIHIPSFTYTWTYCAHTYTDPTLMSPYHTGLPPKNGPLSSSIGSVATLTTVADEHVDPEECGRVAGWVANFDKLLQDSLGVKCLLVSICMGALVVPCIVSFVSYLCVWVCWERGWLG